MKGTVKKRAERAEALGRELCRLEEMTLELRGMIALATGYIRWQPASDSQPDAAEADRVACALENFAQRAQDQFFDLIQVGYLAEKYLAGK